MLYRSVYDIEWKYYDLLYGDFKEDIEFYRKLIDGGNVLELMCGTGRIAGEISKIANVWCLDIDERMLRIASQKNKNIICVHGDARSFHINEKFDYIIFPLNSILLFNRYEKEEALKNAVAHLKVFGKIIIDMVPPLDFEESMVYLGDHKVGDSIEIWRFFVPNYTENMRVLNLTYFYDIFENGTFRRDSAILTLYLENIEEMKRIAEKSGLVVKKAYGDYNMKRYYPESSEKMILVLEMKNEGRKDR